MKRIIPKVKGLTKDNNDRVVTWRERFISEFLWMPEFRNCVITTTYNKTTG